MIEVEVVIEVPRGGLVKWDADGGVDFLSPLPCPFNYGSVSGEVAPDGDPPDAVVVGRRLPRGHRGFWTVRGRVRFLDAGVPDDKLICGAPVGTAQRAALVAFFHGYALGKRLINRVRGRPGPTRCGGWVEGAVP